MSCRRSQQRKATPTFSAWLYDHPDVADVAYADQVIPPKDTPEESRAKADARGPHLVAVYSGGNPNTMRRYEINWYSAASSDTRGVGDRVDSEEFKP